MVTPLYFKFLCVCVCVYLLHLLPLWLISLSFILNLTFSSGVIVKWIKQ